MLHFALTHISEGNVCMLLINAINVGNPYPIVSVTLAKWLRGVANSPLKDPIEPSFRDHILIDETEEPARLVGAACRCIRNWNTP